MCCGSFSCTLPLVTPDDDVNSAIHARAAKILHDIQSFCKVWPVWPWMLVV